VPLNDPESTAYAEDGLFGCEVLEEEARIVLLPVPFDATVSYGRGTARGPRAILQASGQLDLWDQVFGEPWRVGLHWRRPPAWMEERSRRAQAEVDAIHRSRLGPDSSAHAAVNEASRSMTRYVRGEAERLLAAQKIVGVVGGDHSVPLGAIQATGQVHGSFGILHVDAHADLRVDYEGFEQSHASIMHNVLETTPAVKRLVSVGLRDVSASEAKRIEEDPRCEVHWDVELARARLRGQLLDHFDRVVAGLPDEVYLSIDVDGLDPKLCFGTGTPVPGGLDFQELSLLLEAVVRAKKRVIGFDLCEVAPAPGDRELNANVGARVLYKLIGASAR